jgi:hypothetical protein
VAEITSRRNRSCAPRRPDLDAEPLSASHCGFRTAIQAGQFCIGPARGGAARQHQQGLFFRGSESLLSEWKYAKFELLEYL